MGEYYKNLYYNHRENLNNKLRLRWSCEEEVEEFPFSLAPDIDIDSYQVAKALSRAMKPLKKIEKADGSKVFVGLEGWFIGEDVSQNQTNEKLITIEGLRKVITIRTFHSAFSPRGYTPIEVAWQIPEDLRNSAFGYEVEFIDRVKSLDFPIPIEVYSGPRYDTLSYNGERYHIANTTIYK